MALVLNGCKLFGFRMFDFDFRLLLLTKQCHHIYNLSFVTCDYPTREEQVNTFFDILNSFYIRNRTSEIRNFPRNPKSKPLGYRRIHRILYPRPNAYAR